MISLGDKYINCRTKTIIDRARLAAEQMDSLGTATTQITLPIAVQYKNAITVDHMISQGKLL